MLIFLINIVEKVAQTLSEAGFDIEILEKHHNQKLMLQVAQLLLLLTLSKHLFQNNITMFLTVLKKRKREKQKSVFTL